MRDYIWEKRTLINRRVRVIKLLFCQYPASPETSTVRQTREKK
jgi:hypothetical protein